METLARVIATLKSLVVRQSAGQAADALTVGVLKSFGGMRDALAAANDLYDVEVDAIADEIDALHVDLDNAQQEKAATIAARAANEKRVEFLDQFLG